MTYEYDVKSDIKASIFTFIFMTLTGISFIIFSRKPMLSFWWNISIIAIIISYSVLYNVLYQQFRLIRMMNNLLNIKSYKKGIDKARGK